MRQWRTRISCLIPVTLGLFLVSLTVFRPGLFFHAHAGGDHLHIHDDEAGELATHDHHVREHHAHHHEAAHHAPKLPAFETPDDDDALGHWHAQNPFHRIAPVAFHSILHTEWMRSAPVPPQSDCLTGEIASSRARSPPLATLN